MGAVSAITQVVIGFVTMPILLGYLGNNALGIWLIALAVMEVMSLINFSASGVLITETAKIREQNDKDAQATLLSTGFCVFLSMGFALLLICVPVAYWVDWHSLLMVGTAISAQETTAMFCALAVCLSLIYPLNFTKSILLGMHQGSKAYTIEFIGHIFSLMGIILATSTHQPMAVLVLAFFLPLPVLMFAIGGVVVMRQKAVFWTFSKFDPALARHILREAARLGVGSTFLSITFHADVVFIGAIIGAAAATEYGLIQRLFAISILVCATLNNALWPSFSRAKAQGDLYWLRRTFLKAVATTTMGAAIVAFVITHFLEGILFAWVKQTFDFAVMLVAGMMVWAILIGAVSSVSTLLKSLGHTQFLITAQAAMMAVKLGVSAVLIGPMGPSGAIWATIVAYICCLLLPSYIYYRRRMARPH